MIIKITPILISIVLMGAGCATASTQVSTNTTTLGDDGLGVPEAQIANQQETVESKEESLDDSIDPEPSSNPEIISGILIADRFGGTEMDCFFTSEAEIGDRLPCNSGGVGLAILTDENLLIHLQGYLCFATEININQGWWTGKMGVEYETSNCTDELIPGAYYSVEGILEKRENQWYNGKQQDEWWFYVSAVESLDS